MQDFFFTIFFSALDFPLPMCGMNARLVEVVEGEAVCECVEGYEGNGTICTG